MQKIIDTSKGGSRQEFGVNPSKLARALPLLSLLTGSGINSLSHISPGVPSSARRPSSVSKKRVALRNKRKAAKLARKRNR